ncbi:velvet factor-domain-containing protein [Xylariomycetidae sp. FL2044]|nr:velvet factor-domain-containing protein [Xylariomycetidae sp. FL2044]
MLPLQPEQNMMSAMAPNKGLAAFQQRVTKGGRHLWYHLEVLQQPERARACGSGPKSSADRRPVDPPPVVILRVFEGENREEARDITFDYNVDFFCYASLEHARPMAHGRVQTPAATSPPVLTGFPVSGCCYLDRPDPAGYFLFPDLSVRHEGRYRLVFSLYELIKEKEDLDHDAPIPFNDGVTSSGPGDATHRMDLKSADFVVYSAKKFPGLTESTTLSRTVAEQGCRVRIRRDVRMRRRDTKQSAASEFENNNAEDEYTRRRKTQTPDGFRTRSVSNSSMDRAPYVPDHPRRPSNAEYGGGVLYQPAQQMLNFGNNGNAGFAQPFGPAPPSSVQSTPVSPAQPIFPQTPTYQAAPLSPSYPPPAYSHFDTARPDLEKRRSSGSFPPLLAKPQMPYNNASHAGARASIGSEGSSIRTLPSLPSQIASPSSQSSMMYYQSDRSAPLTPIKPSYYMPESRPQKRLAEDTFPTPGNERLVDHSRPNTEFNDNSFGGYYSRADGTKKYREFTSTYGS